jgi:hypothetical protein
MPGSNTEYRRCCGSVKLVIGRRRDTIRDAPTETKLMGLLSDENIFLLPI